MAPIFRACLTAAWRNRWQFPGTVILADLARSRTMLERDRRGEARLPRVKMKRRVVLLLPAKSGRMPFSCLCSQERARLSIVFQSELSSWIRWMQNGRRIVNFQRRLLYWTTDREIREKCESVIRESRASLLIDLSRIFLALSDRHIAFRVFRVFRGSRPRSPFMGRIWKATRGQA